MKDHRVNTMSGLVLLAYCFLVATAAAQVNSGQARWTARDPTAKSSPDSEAPSPTNSAETLADAWRIALANDERIKAGDWNVSAADQVRSAAYAEALPSVNVGANALAVSDQLSITSPAGELPFFAGSSVGFHATVTQPIYTAGKIDSQIAAAGAEASANRSQVQRTKLDVKMNVAEVYIAVLRGRRVLEIAKSKATSLKAHSQDVDNRFQADKASRNEVLAVQVALADAQQQELQASNNLEMMNAAYNRALGRGLSEPVHIVDLQDDGDPGSFDDLVRTAWRHRPELSELAARATGLREQAAAACSETSPQVTLRGGYLYQGDSYVQPNGVAGVALTAEWNLFDSGRASHRATALSDRAEGLLRLRKDAESAIALEIRQRWLEYQTAHQKTAYAKVAIAQADENLRVVRDRYVQQLGSNTEVLDAETLRVQAYMNLYNATYEALLVRLRLRRAAGVL